MPKFTKIFSKICWPNFKSSKWEWLREILSFFSTINQNILFNFRIFFKIQNWLQFIHDSVEVNEDFDRMKQATNGNALILNLMEQRNRVEKLFIDEKCSIGKKTLTSSFPTVWNRFDHLKCHFNSVSNRWKAIACSIISVRNFGYFILFSIDPERARANVVYINYFEIPTELS